MKCRFCNSAVENEFVDLVNSPPSNSYLSREQLNEPEVFYPLKVKVCHNCWLVQIDEYKKSTEIFNADYAYFSSYSSSWLAHSKKYTDLMTQRFNFGPQSLVVELASNDGYLLQYFVEKGIPVLGIEPTANTAEVAKKKGINTIVEFFGLTLAKTLSNAGQKADLILGNNVLAHVPDINDFVKGIAALLKPEGIVTMEFPHLYQLVLNNQFDTIYHEHFSYLSFTTVKKIFEKHGMTMFDVEELPTHGGSLRIFAKLTSNTKFVIENNVKELLAKEEAAGLNTLAYYQGFQEKVQIVKNNLLHFLIEKKKDKKLVAAYGAAAKGNTLLNYCGIKNDLISFVVDANPHKQNKYLPASHIPVVAEDAIKKHKPHYIIILPWNLQKEIVEQLHYIKEWEGRFVVPIPELKVLE